MAGEQQIGLFNPSDAAASQGTPDPDRIPTDVKVPILPGTYNSMEEISQHCNGCQRCDLAEGRTNAVIGRGNPQASVVLVGEGPGQHEDETGLPFVGKSGQLLDKILASVRLTEADVFICNVVKCRPPGNRNPKASEAQACQGYLLEQLRLVDPKIVLLTGAIAMKELLGIREGITKVRGNWYERDGRHFMPIFHPAYLLRNPSREKGSPKWLMWQDIQSVRAKLDELQATS
ncbi:uracil-DNA glycosylase [Vacuolonema iberomarrocanum]|uniref:uracil-DNA glycosylase n=1 Tax=Vacuolonema iberomarrocanum TaxID=3454632 RepID=UPI001A04D8D4|nr:uracil-DNA glycosylase [filamentous cyanobacterium LEGE 07170]